MASKNCDINIPIFDGTDYSNWKIRILKFLQFKKCKDVVMRAKTEADKVEWDDKDVQATNYIYSAISNKQLEYVSELDSAYEIMKKFDQMYLKKSTALQIVCRHNLENIKLKNYSEVSLFFDAFEKAVNELKQAGAVVSETEKLNYMLKALPASYSYIGDLIDVLPEGEKTVDYLKSKIKLKHTENVSEVTNNTSNTFKAETKPSYNCFNCGKPGHLSRDCRSGNVNRGRRHSFYHNRGRGVSNYRGRGLPNYRGHSYNHRRRGSGNHHQNNPENPQHTNSFHTTIVHNTCTTKEENTPENGQITWLLDSGCTDHIINSDKYFNTYETLTKPIKVKIGDGTILEATKIGNIKVYFLVCGQKSEVTLTNVFFVKEMKANLLSYSKITDKYSITSRGKLTKIYDNYGKVIAIAIKDERLYKMKSYMCEEISQVNITKKDMTIKEKLHRTLGHINFNNLELMCKNESLEGLPKEIEYEYLKCAICIENKMHNLPFQNNHRRAEGILDIVHTDLNGPHQTTGYNGEKYFLSFIDDYSKLVKVYCIRSKDEVYDYLVQYVNEVQNLTGKTVKELRCDNGREYINARLFQFAKERGMIIRPCPAYVHQLNGTAERYNRTLMDMGRCLLAEAKVERRFWPEVIKTAAYLKNRTLTNTIERKTPYEIFFRRKPSVQNLKMYGSKVFVRIPEERRRSKWDKAEVGILLGYTDTGYRVLIKNRVIIARNCDVIEEDVKLCGIENEEENNNESNTKEIEKENKKTEEESDKEATSCNEAMQWKEAMNREMDSLMKNNTWTLVNKPPKNKKVIDVKWVYKKKSENEYKASKQLQRRKSVIKDTTFDKQDTVLNTTFEKDNENEKKKDSTFDKSSKHLDVTFDKDLASSSMAKGTNKTSVNTTYDKTDKSDATFEKDTSASFDVFKKGAMTRKSSIRDATFDKSNLSIASLTKEDFEKDRNIISSSATKRRSIRRSTFDKNDTISEDLVNRTFEKPTDTENELKNKSPRMSKSEDIQTILNTTFEKIDVEENVNLKSNSKSSLISSDNSSVSEKSDISRISITSDESSEHIQNIVNTTPLLIESSLDESHVSVSKPETPKPQTPLKREGTFTKESAETQHEAEVLTPSKRKSSVPTAGCTPYHITKSSQKKSMMNVTRSIEKHPEGVDPAPRMTRVMFCSPVDNPVAVAQEKRKIIKSNLKGSNKSFVFEDSASISRPGRKRSYTHSDVEDARVKRSRLTEDLQQSVDRLSRPRTASATGKLAVLTPKKAATPSKPKSESKVSRTKLPNFAALHQKQFAQMESLDECQERRAKRAKQLLTPTAPPGLLDRISPKNNTDSPKTKEPATNQKPKDKTDTPTKKPPTLDSLRPGFTRFGFKLNLDVNPFSIPSKNEKTKEKPVEKPNGVLPRPAVLPSLAGATSVRREVAKSTVMREKSFTERRNVKRNENRTVIKGVRTNRRFELQMKLRNLDQV